jgi:hypothetical protein
MQSFAPCLKESAFPSKGKGDLGSSKERFVSKKRSIKRCSLSFTNVGLSLFFITKRKTNFYLLKNSKKIKFFRFLIFAKREKL